MGIRTLLYLFRLGLKNLWHHRVYTAASVITMSACIFLFGLFYLAAANVDSMVKKTEQEVYVAVFFDEGILPERVEEIGNLIQSRPEVLRTVYVSADEAWSGFKEKYYENAEALDGIFETDNPLASSGNYQVYIDRIGSQEGFVEYVQSIEGVRKTTHSADTVMALLKLRQGAARLIAGSAVLLVLISVLLIHNTLSVGIEAQKEKTRVMRLMGAREGFVKIPFMAEAVVMGAAGVVIPLILLMWLYRWGLAFAVSGLNGLGSLRGLESGLLTEAQVFPGLIRASVLLGIFTGVAGRLCENSFYGGGCYHGSGRSGYPADSSDVAVPLGTCLCRFRSEWSGQPERTGVRASHRGPGISRTYPCIRTSGDFYRGCRRIVCYGEVEA